ncbi:MAG: branched-chain amino acid ABC transporter permease [Deltaproteobacteria bacterium]|nr:branched-chain amino acid ABC transporter permease [Deltaproteobacteria bacterium]
MEVLFLQIGNGLIIGSVYALVALGLNIIWSITDIPDFAQGSFYVLAAYVGLFAVTLAGLPFVAALLLGMAVGALLAFLCERLLYRRWRERTFRDAARVQLLCAIALFFLFANVANALWTGKPRTFPAYMEGAVFGFSYMRINVLIAAIVLFVIVYLFIMKTKQGKAIRAASMDPGMAQVLGVNIDTVNSMVFAIGGALSGGAAVLVAPLYSVFPSMGDLPLLKALVVVILGGFGSVAGVLICGLGLGVIEALGAMYVSSAYQHGYAFFILILVLLLKPKGLFGRV